MVRQVRQMVCERALGRIRIVEVNNLQDWLADTAATDNKQAAWRTDPAQSGSGAIGDIGNHTYNLACFVTGLRREPCRQCGDTHPGGPLPGYLEAVATLYREAADAILDGDASDAADTVIGIQQGLDGMRLMDACQRSSKNAAVWAGL